MARGSKPELGRTVAALSFAAALSCSVLAIMGTACAGTASTTFNVTATVVSACTIGGGASTDLAFGSYDASSGSPNDATSTIAIICTNGVSYTVALNAGVNTGSTVAARRMASGANFLPYGLFTSAARTTMWGDGTLSTSTVAGTGSGASQSLTVYGRIAVSQFVATGAYTDTVTSTVTF